MVNPNYKNDEELKKNVEKGKSWTKQQEKAPSFKITHCPEYDHIKDYHQDPSCYTLISVDKEKKELVVKVCDYQNKILEEFRGTMTQQLYNCILNERKYITRLDHAAYLGKELKKAELALKENKEYIQE
jgi:dihydropteroate synthase